MAHHKSAKKRIREGEKRRLRNRYKKTQMRMLIKQLHGTSDHAEAEALFPKVASVIDKVAKSNIIHKNTAGNMKGKLAKYVNSLAS